MESNSNCLICKTKYVSSTSGIDYDSHEEWTEYKPCPNCGYHQEIPRSIYKILETKTHLSFGPKRGMDMNTQELTDLIVQEIIKFWPKNRS